MFTFNLLKKRVLEYLLKLCQKLQREEDDGIFRPKLINLTGTEMITHLKQLDGILKLYETAPDDAIRFGYLRDEACKVLRFLHMVSDAWSAYKESLSAFLGGDLSRQLPDLEQLKARRNYVYDELESQFLLQLQQLRIKVTLTFFHWFFKISLI